MGCQMNVRTKMSERALRRKHLRKMKKDNLEEIPGLKTVLRKLYLRTHPDLFGQYPEHQRVNEESYKELMGILSTIESSQEFPAARNLNLPFYLKTATSGSFKEVELKLRMTGGACHTIVEEALSTFFKECDLPSAFKWEEGSWGKPMSKDATVNVNMEYDEHQKENEPERRKTADEDIPSAPTIIEHDPTVFEKLSTEEIDDMNDILKVVAAVPFLDSKDHADIKTHYLEGDGLDEFETNNLFIKNATMQIWQGERDLDVLTKGLDTVSCLVVQRILVHAMDIDAKLQGSFDEA
uniref:Uncharacterized protein AlNc14C1G172 n=1 Tax=Albugo laibachii Nc14 TaxID=890382 RepID=F0VZ31_9STRA|nr:conserved hypothetical protein [Albugo laibachii Nc14]|eukprot:CCA14046.1 conserved hypothetical protein [Albugo laibachii Nc14]